MNSTLSELKANNNENLLSQVNILKNNIGKYKGNNTVVFINENYIPKTQIDENKNKLIDNNQQEQKKNGEGHYKKNSNISNHQNNIVSPAFNQNYSANNNSLQNNNVGLNQSNQVNQNYINSQNSINSHQAQINMMNTSEQGNKGSTIKKTTSQNTENNKGQLNEENDKEYIKILQKRKEINNLIYIMIDIEIINNKMNYPLHKSSEEERYYQINLDLFNKYLENRQIQSLFNNNIIIETIKAVLKKVVIILIKIYLINLNPFLNLIRKQLRCIRK